MGSAIVLRWRASRARAPLKRFLMVSGQLTFLSQLKLDRNGNLVEFVTEERVFKRPFPVTTIDQYATIILPISTKKGFILR